MLRLCVLLSCICGSCSLRAGDGLQSLAVSQGGCSSCGDLVHFHKHESISWEIFPPQPLPGIDMAVTCVPNKHKKWGFSASEEVSTLLNDEDCGMGDEGEGLSRKEKRSCKGAYNRLNKRSSRLGVPVAFLQQLGTCGRCTVCEAFAKVKSLWGKLKSAAKKVVSGIKKAKRMLFGYSYAPRKVRQTMEQRFENYFPLRTTGIDWNSDADSDSDSGSSLLQGSAAVEDVEDEHEKQLREELMKHLHGKSEEFVDQHLSMLQQDLEEVDQHDGAMLKAAGEKMRQQANDQRQTLEEQLPTLLNNADCQKLLASSLTSQVLTITLYVEMPHILNAIIDLVIGNIYGALHSLIPKIYLHTAPHFGEEHDAKVADRCLAALREERQPLLESCTHEHPLLACTARVSQRLMEGALSQQWWPLRHDEHGTLSGSIDLGYKFDELMNSLRCSTEGSCLEKSVVDLEREEVSAKNLRASASMSELTRLEKMQCAISSSRVDAEDGGKEVPGFTDKIWAAGLKAYAEDLKVDQNELLCPDMMPFAVAFCAHELKCMDANSAGQGFLKPVQFNNVRAHSLKNIEVLNDITPETAIRDGGKDFPRITEAWEDLMHHQADYWGTDQYEDISQWNRLWHLANFTSKVGLMPTWPMIRDAVLGRAEVDWMAAKKFWRKVADLAFAKLKVRDMERPRAKKKKSKGKDPALIDVMANLKSIYETKFCSPGALGSLTTWDDEMARLGIGKEDIIYNNAMRDETSQIITLWEGWSAFNIHFGSEDRQVQEFKQALEESSCSCMCYSQCGKPKASAFVHCNSGRDQDPSFHDTDHKDEYVIANITAPKLTVDKVYAIGDPFEDAHLSIVKVNVPGDCSFRFEMTGRAPLSERKEIVKKSGYISQCDTPKFVHSSASKSSFRVTTWSSPRATVPPFLLYLNQQADDLGEFYDELHGF